MVSWVLLGLQPNREHQVYPSSIGTRRVVADRADPDGIVSAAIQIPEEAHRRARSVIGIGSDKHRARGLVLDIDLTRHGAVDQVGGALRFRTGRPNEEIVISVAIEVAIARNGCTNRVIGVVSKDLCRAHRVHVEAIDIRIERRASLDEEDGTGGTSSRGVVAGDCDVEVIVAIAVDIPSTRESTTRLVIGGSTIERRIQVGDATGGETLTVAIFVGGTKSQVDRSRVAGEASHELCTDQDIAASIAIGITQARNGRSDAIIRLASRPDYVC